MQAQLEDEPDEGLSTFSATQQEKKIADKLAENSNDIKVKISAIFGFLKGMTIVFSPYSNCFENGEYTWYPGGDISVQLS